MESTRDFTLEELTHFQNKYFSQEQYSPIRIDKHMKLERIVNELFHKY